MPVAHVLADGKNALQPASHSKFTSAGRPQEEEPGRQVLSLPLPACKHLTLWCAAYACFEHMRSGWSAFIICPENAACMKHCTHGMRALHVQLSTWHMAQGLMEPSGRPLLAVHEHAG